MMLVMMVVVVALFFFLLATGTTWTKCDALTVHPPASGQVLATQVSSRTTPLLFKFFSSILDMDGDGVVDAREIAFFLTHTYDKDIPATSATEVVALMDLDGDGTITFAEFRATYGQSFADEESTTSPQGVHLSCTEEDGEAYVVWETETATAGPDVVQWGTAAGTYTSTSAPAAQFTYESGQAGFYYEGWLKEAHLTNLSAGVRYYYRVGSEAGGWSQEFAFVNAPSRAARKEDWSYPLRYLTFGDMGTVPFGRNVTEAITAVHATAAGRYDMTIHLGDIAYAGTGSTNEWNIIWEIFCRQIEPFAATSFYMTTVGNHEKYYDYTAYRHRFRMPQGGHPSPPEDRMDGFYYSFTFGPIHFCNVPSDSYPPNYPNPRAVGSDVYNWMAADLARAAANRDKVPFIVVTAHRPMYSTTNVGGWDDQREGWEPLLQQYNVDLFLAGHIHAYERTYPLYNYTTTGAAAEEVYINPTMPIHITIGTAGAWVGADRWEEEQPWLAAREFSYGFAHIIAINSTTLHFQYFSFAAIRNGGDDPLFDEFYLVKN